MDTSSISLENCLSVPDFLITPTTIQKRQLHNLRILSELYTYKGRELAPAFIFWIRIYALLNVVLIRFLHPDLGTFQITRDLNTPKRKAFHLRQAALFPYQKPNNASPVLIRPLPSLCCKSLGAGRRDLTVLCCCTARNTDCADDFVVHHQW